MKEIKLYLASDFATLLQEWDEVKPFKILNVDEKTDLWEGAINLNNKFYYVCCSQGNNYQLRELEQFKIDEKETFDENEIKCPICGYEDVDSWEYDNESGEKECVGCGALLEWSREVIVTYSAEIKQVVQPLKL